MWSPFADAVSVRILDADGRGAGRGVDGPEGDERCLRLERGEGDLWTGDLVAPAGTRYMLRVERDGEVHERIDPRAREVTNSVGASVVVDPRFDWTDGSYRRRPLNEWVIYELHPKTFGGDLDGVTAHLDHLAGLGVTAVELMPVSEFAGDVSWGYNPALPFAVESSYGGPAALRRFVDAAHALGIAVVIDVVYNHLGPSDLDLWQFDGWSENDGGGIYFYNDWRAETAWGATRPDYGRQEVRRYLIDNARMWFEEYHVDGLRLDSTVNIRNAHGRSGPDGDLDEGWTFLADLVEEIHASFPGAVMIAEDLQTDPRITASRADGGLGFDLQWSAGFVHPVRSALEELTDEARNLDAVVNAVTAAAEGPRRVVYTESHDEVANGRTRVPAEVDPGNPGSVWAFRRSALGAALVMSSPGVPMLFQGQEWGDEDWFDDARDIDWSRNAERTGFVQLWRDLIGLRTGLDDRAPGMRGDQIHVERSGPNGQILVLHRWGIGGPEASSVIIANFSSSVEDAVVRVPASGQWHCVLATDWTGYHDSGSDAVPVSVGTTDDGTITLPSFPAYTAAVFVRE